MMSRKYLTILLVLFVLPVTLMGQKFSVAHFKLLQNDISAYINPVKDLNDEACALVKVICSHDFAFSTPLGIVERKNEVGEIWLYIPKGSIMLTLKHPKWGVIRDYRFPAPLEGRLTYEIRLNTPEQNIIAVPQTTGQVVRRETIILRDTLMAPPSAVSEFKVPKEPVEFNIYITAGFSNNLMYGMRLFVGRKHGGYISGMYDFKKVEANGIEGVYDTGKVKYRCWNFLAGAYHLMGKSLFIYEGLGYGHHNVYWEKIDGEWWKNINECTNGYAVETGLGYKFKHMTFTAGITTLKCKVWIPNIGISYSF